MYPCLKIPFSSQHYSKNIVTIQRLWGNRQGSYNDVSEFKKAINAGDFNGRKAVLGFNE